MAKQDSLFPYRGNLGDTTGVKRKGKYFLRKRSRKKVKQTPATKNAAALFGMASKTAAFIRKSFHSVADIKADDGHINRLTKLLIPSAGQDISAIIGYRFNQSKSLKNPQKAKVIAIRLNFTTREIIDTEPDINLPGEGTLIIALQLNTATEITEVRSL